jgi:hypothetical protein
MQSESLKEPLNNSASARRRLCGLIRRGFGERGLVIPTERVEPQRVARKGPSRRVIHRLLGFWLSLGLLAGLGLGPGLNVQASESASITDIADAHIMHTPYHRLELEPLQQALEEQLETDPESVFLPGHDLGPLTRALVNMEAVEGRVEPARYRLRYGLQHFSPDGESPVTVVSLVQVDRFNLAPAHRQELIRIHGLDRVRPADEADQAAHVSWRMASRPLRGTVALPIALSRAEIPEVFAESMDCLGVSCTSLTSVLDASDGDWQEGEPLEVDFEAPYAISHQGVPTVAALLELLLADAGALQRNDGFNWRGFEFREGVAPGAAFVDIIIETGLGQDQAISGVLRDDRLMDHETRTRWVRIRAVATTPEQAPVVELSRKFVLW